MPLGELKVVHVMTVMSRPSDSTVSREDWQINTNERAQKVCKTLMDHSTAKQQRWMLMMKRERVTVWVGSPSRGLYFVQYQMSKHSADIK